MFAGCNTIIFQKRLDRFTANLEDMCINPNVVSNYVLCASPCDSINQKTRIADYTPNYMFDFKAAYRLMELLGPDRSQEVKFLVMIREPVSRAFSNWVMKKTFNGVADDFHTVFRYV